VGAAIAVGLHGLLALGVVTIDPARFRSEQPIEIDVDEKLPPPEIKPPPPEPPPPPPEPPRPRIAHKMPTVIPKAAPPPPSDEPPKPDEPPPTFGVKIESTVGESSVAVPVGQTLMTKPAVKKETPKAPPSGDGSGGFVPVADIYIAKYAENISCPDGEDFYPPDAKRLGIEGFVDLRVGIDQTGKVVQVKISGQRAGHGFDEAAIKAVKLCKFKPAVTSDGRVVPSAMPWRYRFESER
jgi:protein TonB